MQTAVVKDILMGAAQCILLLGMLLVLPLVGVISIAFLPLPVLFYRLKLGRNNGFILVGIVLAMSLAVTGSLGMDSIFLAALLASGLFLGECIERQMDISRIIGFSILGIIGVCLLALILFAGFRGESPAGFISGNMAQYSLAFTQLYSNMGVSQEQATMLVGLIMMVFPGMLITSFISIMLLNVLIIRGMLSRRGIELKNLAHLTSYRMPDFLVWCVIGLAACLILSRYVSGNMGGLVYMGINGMLVLMLMYFFQGIAIVAFFMEKKNVPMFARVFCYALVVLQFYFSVLVIGVGFFDHWANFRKLDTEPC